MGRLFVRDAVGRSLLAAVSTGAERDRPQLPPKTRTSSYSDTM